MTPAHVTSVMNERLGATIDAVSRYVPPPPWWACGELLWCQMTGQTPVLDSLVDIEQRISKLEADVADVQREVAVKALAGEEPWT